ncbi:MAG: hypothetical protein AAF530_10435 [Pseudomonadota bacterium]
MYCYTAIHLHPGIGEPSRLPTRTGHGRFGLRTFRLMETPTPEQQAVTSTFYLPSYMLMPATR